MEPIAQEITRIDKWDHIKLKSSYMARAGDSCL
jgi:hypothetical protein